MSGLQGEAQSEARSWMVVSAEADFKYWSLD